MVAACRSYRARLRIVVNIILTPAQIDTSSMSGPLLFVSTIYLRRTLSRATTKSVVILLSPSVSGFTTGKMWILECRLALKYKSHFSSCDNEKQLMMVPKPNHPIGRKLIVPVRVPRWETCISRGFGTRGKAKNHKVARRSYERNCEPFITFYSRRSVD